MKKKIFSLLTFLFLFQLGSVAWAGEGVAEVDSGITAWMLTSTALVLLMVPGLAMFYGGLVRTKNVLGTMMHSFAAMAIIGVLWAVCGYAMSFGPNVLGGWIGWNPSLLFLSPHYDIAFLFLYIDSFFGCLLDVSWLSPHNSLINNY